MSEEKEINNTDNLNDNLNYKIFTYGGFFLSLIAFIFNILLDLHTFLNIVVVLLTIFFGSIIIYGKKSNNKYKIMFYSQIIILTVFFPIIGITNGGLDGPIFLVFIIELIIIITYFKKKDLNIMMFFYFFSSLIIIYISLYESELIIEYKDINSRYFDNVISYLITSIFIFFLVRKLFDENSELIIKLNNLNEDLYKSSITDSDTGLKTKEYIYDYLKNKEFNNINNSAILMFDIDNFKEVNDNFGHIAGDKLLNQLGEFLDGFYRETDIIARYGGDEFIIALGNINDRNKVIKRTNYMTKEIEKRKWTSYNINITISGGLYFMNNNDKLEVALVKVDKALYNAKKEGKNRLKVIK